MKVRAKKKVRVDMNVKRKVRVEMKARVIVKVRTTRRRMCAQLESLTFTPVKMRVNTEKYRI